MTRPGPRPPADRWVRLFDGHVCSLGYDLIDWIEAFTCHGPGDVQGDPIELDAEWRKFLVDAYELDPATGRRVRDGAVLSRPKGRAKALALDTPIPTPGGWATVGDINLGDTVFDESGRPTIVLGVSEVFRDHECFEVVFSDGERIVADVGHRWTVQELRKEYREVTVDTGYLAEHQSTRADGACNFRLRMPQPLSLPPAPLPVDPYVLGVWLGDGNTRGASVTLADDEIVDQLRGAGYRVEHRPSYGPFGHWVFGLRPQLRDLGVLGHKHVPEAYLRASADQRLALLQGLMDTDGTIGTDGRAGFTSTLERLADAVVELLATLGIKCAKREFRTKMNGRDCGPGWMVDFWPTADVPAFRLSRKLARQRSRNAAARSRLADTRRIVAVRSVESVPTRCIAVASPSKLFLAGRRMVQTHNSELAGAIAVAEAFAPVRFDGWSADGQPVGRPIRSPLIKCLATEETQVGNTFENVAFVAADWGPDVHPDIYAGVSGARRYQSATSLYLPHGGEIVAATSGAASKDGGKEPLALDTAVLTTTGWRTVGTLDPGDHVFGPDGQPVLVYGKTPVKHGRPCYRVTFDDGTSVVTDHRHSWTVFDRWRAGSKRHREDGFEPWRTLTTEQLLRLSLHLRDGSRKERGFKRFGLPRGAAVDLPKRDLPLDPYVLGLWLGDGDARVATIAMGDEDRSELVSILNGLGFATSVYDSGSGCPVVRFDHGTRYGKSGTSQHALRDLGVLRNKHVPGDYLLGSVDQRLALLQGLMDSDGSASTRGNCVFVNKDRGLCEAVTALVRSLGWRTTGVSVWKSDTRWKSETGSYRVSFTPDGPWAPFRLARKAARCRTAPTSKMRLRTIVSIEPAESVPVACVAVDSDDHLFLVGESLIPTHNTFVVADEVHLYVTAELRGMYATISRNLGKRKAAEPWLLSTTTMYRAGEGSVAEDIFRAWRKGELRESTLIDHRQAKGRIDLEDEAHTMRQLREVYGSAADWVDLERFYRDMRDPTVCADVATAARYFLNRVTAGSTVWIADDVVERQARRDVVADGEPITIGFDGSLSDDSTVLIGCRVSDGFLFPLGIWERPEGPEQIGWEVDRADVDATVDEAFSRYTVRRMYCDPHEWRSDIGTWSERYPGRVAEWATNRWVAIDAALDRLRTDLVNGGLWHSGDPRFMAHLVHAAPVRRGRLTLVGKPSHERKIDSVIGAALAYEARADVLVEPPPKKRPGRVRGYRG